MLSPIFSHQICDYPSPYTVRERGGSPANTFLMPEEPTFSGGDTKWVTSLFWLRYKFPVRTCPLFYFQNQMASLVPPEALTTSS